MRGVFLYEPDEGQIIQNSLEREPATGPQTTRARVSALRAAWICDTCEELGIAALPARLWDTLFDRVIDGFAAEGGGVLDSLRIYVVRTHCAPV